MGERSNRDEGMAPDDLNISEDSHVFELGGGRFVISPEQSSSPDPEPAALEADARKVATETLDRQDVGTDLRSVLQDHVTNATGRHGFLISAKFDDEVRHYEAYADDIDEVFGTLLVWYADQVDDETPVEDVLGILLAASAVDVRLPKGMLRRLVVRLGLGPDDSIADLLAAVSEEGGLRLSQRR